MSNNIYYSQQGEDFFIYRNFINQYDNNGIFLELGACDGIKYSNTLFFEKYLGFKGILIEPIYEMFEKLKKNREKNICINCIISNDTNNQIMLNNGAVSTNIKNADEKFIKRWHKRSKTIIINSQKLSNIFKENNIKYIDFFSLDVEGSELDVLHTIIWSEISIYLICIELDNYNKNKNDQCKEILINNNFTFKMKIGINEIWENNNYFRKKKIFKNIEKKIFSGDLNDYGNHIYLEKKAKSSIEKEILEFEMNNNLK